MLLEQGQRRLVLTAHPDDETLWCGGLLVRYPGNWTVICCSIPERDPVRAWKFYEACAKLGATGKTLPYTEIRRGPLRCLNQIDISAFEVILTHNAAGEYGHSHHVQVNRFAASAKKKFGCQVATFGYGDKRESFDLVVHLTEQEWQAKLSALKCYDHEVQLENKMRPTWDALVTEYGTPGKMKGYNLRVESYAAM